MIIFMCTWDLSIPADYIKSISNILRIHNHTWIYLDIHLSNILQHLGEAEWLMCLRTWYVSDLTI